MKASVCVITYNHARFIAQALEGILSQQLDFDYEIVIGEDCSTDNTRDIVLEYGSRFPKKIRLLLSKKNLGMMPNFIQTIQACRGEYIALCEGDDYWTSPHKLQAQVDFLDKHPEFTICSHNVWVKYENSSRPSAEWLGTGQKEILQLEDVLRDGSGGATCSLVFRNRIFGEFPDWYYNIAGGDWALQALCASRGKFRYMPGVMGVYRRHERGAAYAETLKARSKGQEAIAIPSKNSLEICDALDKHFNYRFTRLIQKQKAHWYWIGAFDYVRWADTKSARAWFLKAMPGLWPRPRWLSVSIFLKGLLVVLLPPPLSSFFIRSLFRMKIYTWSSARPIHQSAG